MSLTLMLTIRNSLILSLFRTTSPTLGLKIRLSLWPTLRPTLRPSLIPTEYFTKTPLLHLTADDAKDGDKFDKRMSVFEDWAITEARYYDNVKDRSYLYKIESVSWNHHQSLQ